LVAEEENVDANKEAEVLDTIEASEAPEIDVAETPAAFLTGVTTTLKASENIDSDLAEILSDHLLNVSPHADAVANAKAAITALAANRAAPAEEKADG